MRRAHSNGQGRLNGSAVATSVPVEIEPGVRARSNSMRVLNSDERKLVRAMYQEHLRVKKEINAIEVQLLDLMQKRDDLHEEASRCSATALQKKFGVGKTTILYCIRARSTDYV